MRINKIFWTITFLCLTALITLMIIKGDQSDKALIFLELILLVCWGIMLNAMIKLRKRIPLLRVYQITVMSRVKCSEAHGPCIRVMIFKGKKSLETTIFKDLEPDLFEQLDYAAALATHFPFITNVTVKSSRHLRKMFK